MPALSGIVKLFVGKPMHPVGADGRMALSDHLRELRARVLKVALTLVVAVAVSLFFFDTALRPGPGPLQHRPGEAR